MKHLSFQTICALCIAVLMFSSCSKELDNLDSTVNDEVQLKSASGPKDFMVITNSESLSDDLVASLKEYGEVTSTIPEIGIAVVKTSNSNFEKKVAKLSDVRSVVPDYNAKWLEPLEVVPMTNPPSIGDDENSFWKQWGLDAINAPEAWNAGYTGKGAKVFILDSGIDADHPDLSPNLDTTLSTSFVPDEDYDIQPGVYFNHGSHVAGIIAGAHNGVGIIGVAPNTDIVAVKVLSEYTGSGNFSWINQGIVYAANNGADVINMSLGATVSKNGFYVDDNDELQKVPAVYMQEIILAQQRAINYAHKKGVTIVCSAGNGGANYDGNGALMKLPAELNNVIAVSATAPDLWAHDIINGIDPFLDIPASYTDYGRSLVDIAAPGGDFDNYPDPYYVYDMILSASSQSYYFSAGTSMAAPHVAGVAALIVSKNGGNITNNEVEKQLLKTADHISGNGKSLFYGKGRVNAFRAVTE